MIRKPDTKAPCHPMFRSIIQEELEARGWTDPAVIIAALGKTTALNVERLLAFDNRLTYVECYFLDRAFGTSEEFFWRLQRQCEKCDPVTYAKNKGEERGL